MQQIYRRTSMLKCDFNKVYKNTYGGLLLATVIITFSFIMIIIIINFSFP